MWKGFQVRAKKYIIAPLSTLKTMEQLHTSTSKSSKIDQTNSKAWL